MNVYLVSEAVLFVTATPNSQLSKNIAERLKNSKIPIKVAEKAGVKLSQVLVNTNPSKVEVCDREGCLPCETREEGEKGKSRCDKEGVVYTIQCKDCPPEDKAVYFGETSTTGFIRGKEHWAQYQHSKKGNVSGKDSVLGRHVREKHDNNHEVAFSMKIVSHHPCNTHLR